MPRVLKAEGRDFRNYKTFSLSFDKSFNTFYGSNGQGKTSFLEALFTGLKGKSFRPHTSFDFIREGKNQAEVCLRIKETEGESTLVSTFQKAEKEKRILYCGKKIRRDFLEKKFPVLVFTAEKLDVIKRSAAERRALTDEFLVFQEKKTLLLRYKSVLRQKTAFLFAYQKGECGGSAAVRLLDNINEVFLKAAEELIKGRLSLLNRLFQETGPVAEALFSSLPPPRLGFKYYVSDSPVTVPEEGARLMREDLARKTGRELKAGRPLSGPHLQEIKFLFNGKDSRTFCSQGQQRLFILSLMATQIKPAAPPILFLDDVLSELDDEAQKRLLSFLEKTKSQIFLTSCRKVPWMTKKMSFFSVKNGTIGSLHE